MTAIRTATVDDAQEIAALVNSCYRGDSSRAGWTTEADLLGGTRTDGDDIERLMTAGDSIFLLLTENDEIIGSVHIQKEGSSCYLGMLVVKPRLQGGGIGRQVMQAAEDYARTTWRSEKMTMTVFTVRTELLSYYERRGYRRTGEFKPFVSYGVNGVAKVEGLEFEVLEKPLI